MDRIIYNSNGGETKKGQKSRAFRLKCLVLRRGRVRHPVRNGYNTFEIILHCRYPHPYKDYCGATIDRSHRSSQLIWRGKNAIKLMDLFGFYTDDKHIYKAGT